MSQISSTSGTSGGSNATLTAFFDHRHHAEDAMNRLIDAGISQSNVRLLPGYESDQPAAQRTEAHRGFFESLADFFMPNEDRYSYAEGLSRGGYLVTVTNISGTQYDTALDILDDEGAVNLDEREQNWRSEGWAGYQGGYSDTEPSSGYNDSSLSGSGSGIGGAAGLGAGSGLGATGSSGLGTAGFGAGGSSGGASGAAAYGNSTGTGLGSGSSAGLGSGYSSTGMGSQHSRTSTGTLGNEEVIPVIEEELLVGKREVNNGRVRVRSYVRETPVSEQVSLRDERVTLERRPVDRALSGTDTAFQDREIEAEEHSEQAVVSKEARVVEEVALRKESDVRTETVSDTVRSTEVEVEDERGMSNRTTGTGTFDRR